MDIPLLRSSFELVVERSPEITTRFYEILFERYPEVRPLFGRQQTRDGQARMLKQALAAVLHRIEDSAWLTRTLEAMGERHVGYGVTAEMYPWVGECLLAALSEAAGPDWTEAMQASWAEAYGVIAAIMQTGARRAERPSVESLAAI